MITIQDIKSEVCRKCAACCKISIPCDGDMRYKEFIEKLGYTVRVIGASTGCREGLKMMIDLGDCKHLQKEAGLYSCAIYEARPKMCRDFNCVAWSLPSNTVEQSELCRKAASILKDLQKENK